MSSSRHAKPGHTTPHRSKARRPTSWPLVVLALLGVALLAAPLASLLVRAPWTRMAGVLAGDGVRQALLLSLACASLATLVAVLLGVPLAWLLAHGDGWWRTPLRALVTLPLVLPPVVGGVALLMAFGRNGVLGRWLDAWFGITLPFSTAAVVLAETFVAMPFLVVSLEGALSQREVALEEAAQTMGASPWQVFRYVTLPLAAPSLGAGMVLCWARALGEFGATITFAGNFPGTTQTMPLAVYLAMQSDPDAAVALSVLLLAVCAAVLVALRGSWWGEARRNLGR